MKKIWPAHRRHVMREKKKKKKKKFLCSGTGSCYIFRYVTRFLFFSPHPTQSKPPLISSFFLLHIFGTPCGTLSTDPFENDTAKNLLELFLHFTY